VDEAFVLALGMNVTLLSALMTDFVDEERMA
jgi:hypothetical protein